MKIIKLQKILKIFVDLRFAILLLLIIAGSSSLGSFIEQDESLTFYKENYPSNKPIFGFIDYKFLVFFGFDHIYQSWWFILLLLFLGISLVSCTITRQFPLVKNSKKEFFKRDLNSFLNLPFFIKTKNSYFFKENLLLKLKNSNFSIFQKKDTIYLYKGLIGRISPILVHASLILILLASFFGAFKNVKIQEFVPKGEIFRFQNIVKIGSLRNLAPITIRLNDFWIDYENNKIHQFYSNLSILDNFGNELKQETISVNNPLKFKSFDFYQSDWNLIGIRTKFSNSKIIYEYPLFNIDKKAKIWITWLKYNNEIYTIVFDKLQNSFNLYDEKGQYIQNFCLNQNILNKFIIIEILPSSGILIKSDPSIPFIYLGFFGLILTTFLSYLPFTQIWICKKSDFFFIGGNTNRGKLQLEIEFENLIRYSENIKLKK
jgi:cytochrome c biogenesis protein